MSAKALLPDQCVPLHYIYGAHDCCLCKSGAELVLLKHRIEELERELGELIQTKERVNSPTHTP